MPDHFWRCNYCGEENPPYTEACRNCYKPSLQAAEQIAHQTTAPDNSALQTSPIPSDPVAAFKGTFTANDLIYANWVHMRPRPGIAIAGGIVAVLACWALGYMLYVLFTNPGVFSGWQPWLLPAAVAYLVVMFGVFVPYKCRRSYRQRKDLQRECAFRASHAGLAIETENVHGQKPWTDYIKWKEGKKAFLLYLSDNLYQLIPKRFLASESDVTKFRDLVRQKVSRHEA